MTRTPSPALAVLVASIAFSLASSAALAAAPSAPASTAPASSAPFPDLTMAPLVTPPPSPPIPAIVAPSTDEQGIPVDGYALGDAAAPVTIEVYEDFQCPYCRQFTAQVEPQVIDTYVRPGAVRLVFRDLPFLGEESRWASVAARLASEQDLFWPLHDYLFANQLGENVGSFTPDRLMAMAQAAGLDMDRFIAGLQVPAARALYAQVEAEAYKGASAAGITATPTVIVNGVPLTSSDFASIAAAVDAALAASVPSPSVGASLPSPAASALPPSPAASAP